MPWYLRERLVFSSVIGKRNEFAEGQAGEAKHLTMRSTRYAIV